MAPEWRSGCPTSKQSWRPGETPGENMFQAFRNLGEKGYIDDDIGKRPTVNKLTGLEAAGITVTVNEDDVGKCGR